MKRLLAVFGILALVAVATGAYAANEAAKAKTITLKGEVVDTGCYLGHGARGEKHKECALKCASNGMPIALLTDKGKLYLLTPNHDSADAFNQAKGMAGAMVQVTGTVMEKGGLTALDVTAVKEASPAAK
jgi:type 1 fimbria pilin